MNSTRRTQGPNWVRITAISIILAIAAFQWYQNNRQGGLASQEGSRPPAGPVETRTEDQQNQKKSEPQPRAQKESNSNTKRSASTTDRSSKPDTSGGTQKSSTSGSIARPSTPQDPDSFLQPSGGNNLKSPAGLIYGMGPGGEHRVEHVMRHAQDDPDRPSHSVFDGDQDSILKLIDEAYELVKTKSKYVKSEESQGNTAYTISLGRRIGYEGGEKGERSNHRALKSLRLILDGDRVITAYPYR